MAIIKTLKVVVTIDETGLSPGRVAVTVRDFVAPPECHLRKEEALLASGQQPRTGPDTVNLGGHPHKWTRSHRAAGG